MSLTSLVPKRILMTSDTLGGVWNYSLDLIEALADFNVQVVLATMGKPLNRNQREAIRKLSNVDVFESSYRLEWMDHPSTNTWKNDLSSAAQWLLDLEDEVYPDIVHLNGFVHAQLNWKAPCICVAHSDVFSWYESVKESSPPSHWSFYYDEVKRGLLSADLVIAPTREALESLSRHYFPHGLKPKQTRVIPNGIDLSRFKEAKKEKFLFSIGRLWDEAKNFELLSRVALSLDWPVLVAGSLESPSESTSNSRSFFGLHCIGEVSSEDIAQYLSRCSLYVHPSVYEPFGLSILEAAASGCALILSDIPSLRENWQNSAVFFDPKSEDSLFDAIHFLITHHNERERLAQNAKDRSRFFSRKRMASSYWNEYRKLYRPHLPLSQEQHVAGE